MKMAVMEAFANYWSRTNRCIRQCIENLISELHSFLRCQNAFFFQCWIDSNDDGDFVSLPGFSFNRFHGASLFSSNPRQIVVPVLHTLWVITTKSSGA